MEKNGGGETRKFTHNAQFFCSVGQAVKKLKFLSGYFQVEVLCFSTRIEGG